MFSCYVATLCFCGGKKIQVRYVCLGMNFIPKQTRTTKTTFKTNPLADLLTLTKARSGELAKKLLENINTTIRQKIGLNQWKNSTSVINWFSSIQDKQHNTPSPYSTSENFYPSITEKLLTDAITFAKQHTSITDPRH